jgi:predicted small metal-binding protein
MSRCWMNCNFVAQGNTEKEILDKAGSHAQQVHKLPVTPELTEKVKSLIHEDSSEAHRRSMAARRS